MAPILPLNLKQNRSKLQQNVFNCVSFFNCQRSVISLGLIVKLHESLCLHWENYSLRSSSRIYGQEKTKAKACCLLLHLLMIMMKLSVEQQQILFTIKCFIWFVFLVFQIQFYFMYTFLIEVYFPALWSIKMSHMYSNNSCNNRDFLCYVHMFKADFFKVNSCQSNLAFAFILVLSAY